MANSYFWRRRRAGRLVACLVAGVLAIAIPHSTLAFSLTTTTLSLSASPSSGTLYSGQAITYTATVSAASGSPGGTVTFTVDGIAGSPVALDSSHSATLVFHPLVGPHTVGATYSGDSNFTSSSATSITQTVSKAATSVDMASNPAQIAQAVAIRAAVTVQTPGTGTPGGTVDFANGTNSISGCTGVPVQNGVAICNTAFPQLGLFVIGTIYNGDTQTAPSGGSLSLTVGKVSPGVYLAADPTTQANGGLVTLGALVLGATGVATPSGTVTFSDGSSILTTVPMGTDGHATLLLPSGPVGALGPGTHTIGALYNGDPNYQTARASSVTVTITGKSATSVTLTAGVAQVLQPVTIKATVFAAGSGAVSGTVDFANGANPITGCTGLSLQAGVAACTTTFMQGGAVTVNASYSGDSSNIASNGSTQLTVAKATSWVFLTAAPASPSFGTTVTLSALVTGSPGLAMPGGTLTFSDGTAALGTVPVGSDGRASLAVPSGSLTPFSIGSHSLSVVYNGDNNYLTATAPVILVVSKSAATLTLSSTAAQLAQPVKITATLSASAGGTVDFSSGSTPIAGCTAIPVQAGAALCNTSFLQLGTVSVGASYSGDASNAPTTATLPLTVGKCSASAYLATTPANPAYGATVTLGSLVMGATGVANPTGTVTFQDGSTPLATVTLSSDGHAPLLVPSGAIAPFPTGAHTITAVYSGDSNYLTATATPVVVTIGKAGTTITLAATPDSPKTGQTTTLTATITPAASGTVAFSNGATPIANCTASPIASGVATCTTSFPQTGTFTITASYSGDGNTGAAAGALPLTVGQAKAPATVSLQVTPPLTVFGSSVTITLAATPASNGPAPTGTVTFTDGTTTLATIPLNVLGQAALSLPSPLLGPLAVGTHTVGATYVGDTNYAGATAQPVTLTVGKATTTTVLSAPYGGPFTATVSVVQPGAGTPTGQVQFAAGGGTLATAPLQQLGTAFVATFPRNTQTGSITAAYAGDANFSSSSGAPVTVTAPRASSTIASNHNPATLGQTVTFTVSVTNNSGAGTPTGTVQLTSDGVSIGAAMLSDGVASLDSAALAVGTHNIVASYAGDATYSPASASLSQVVNKAAATLALTSTPAQSVFGQPVTLTAQWQSSATAPTAQIQFFDGATALGSAVMPAGTAALTVANLPVGTHSITATWNGDSTSAAISSAPVAQVVGKAQTVTTLTGHPTSVTGGVGTLTATVAATAPGAGTPAGSVKFVNAATNAVLQTVNLSAGSASTPFPSVTDAIVAIYAGDSNFQTSTSDPLVQLAVTNSASYAVLNLAADEIVTLFGSNLASAISYATPQPADALSGTTVKITDTAGVVHSAQLFYVSPAQASVLVPSDVTPGPATLMVSNPNQAPITIPVSIAPVAPGLFTSNSTGQGIAAAQVIRVHQNGTQDAPQNVAVFDSKQNLWVPAPIDLGTSTDTVYVLLYGTGFRHYASMPQVTIGGKPVGVAYAGAQGSFPGLDQVNLLLPATLRGLGTVNLILTVDGIAANTVTLAVQ